MKERLTLALSWYAFAHTALIAFVFLFAATFDALRIVLDLDLSPSDWGWFDEALRAYIDIFGDIFGSNLSVFAASPAIWLGLWLTTGKPRILPWK
jgi:hypothetical protein